MKLTNTVKLGLAAGLFWLTADAGRAGTPDAPIAVAAYKAPIRVACVGDSITFGAHTANPVTDAYPAQLNRMLDARWDVRNFGVSGSTLLNHGDRPYQKQEPFQQALAFAPDVVVIMLGTNDTKPQNWKLKAQFIPDYKDLLQKFRALASKPRIFICYPPMVTGPRGDGINEADVLREMPMIDELAKSEGLGVIDLYHIFAGKAALLPDHVHPTTEGATLMARTVFKTLAGREFTGAVPATKATGAGR